LSEKLTEGNYHWLRGPFTEANLSTIHRWCHECLIGWLSLLRWKATWD